MGEDVSDAFIIDVDESSVSNEEEAIERREKSSVWCLGPLPSS
jgi:hypothetical protein